MKGQKGEQIKLLTGGDSLMAYETEDQETQYCFPDINSSCVKGKRSSHGYNITYLFVSLLSAWTVFLNLLVIISISHFKKLHTPTNMIILSLAVNDLLIGLIVMPVDAVKLIETCWYFGDTLCDLYMIIMGLLLSASLSNLILIAVDRYVAVCHPLLYPQKITMTKTLISIFICWFVCLTNNIAFLVSSRHFDVLQKTNMCHGQCTLIVSFSWTFTDLFLSFLVPCTLIITLYLRIFYVAYQQVKVINSIIKGGKCAMDGSVKRKSERKAALTLGIVVTVYLLCYIPYYMLSVIGTTVISSTMTFLIWSLYINSCLNPLIYALFYRWFKISVKCILTLKILEPASSLLDIFKDYP
ncbi:trace amine-associated receptor 13c-like [Danio aesculapii]|uniref:trace amine-associated receptor 13c-like n=1 Tax=Danio aesculapii TaxID=1142201 RepID=UPI0024BF9B6D|nr:trace amine-associated receptor 13c-like [Danio aesculapii]